MIYQKHFMEVLSWSVVGWGMQVTIEMNFSPCLYKHLLGWPLDFEDLQDLDPDLAR